VLAREVTHRPVVPPDARDVNRASRMPACASLMVRRSPGP
jgi:hypothetical protein